MSTSVALKRPLRKASPCCIACRSCGIDSRAVGSAPQAQGARLLLVHRRLAHQRRHRLCHKAVPSEAGGDLGAISQSTERGTGGTSAEPQQPCSSEQPSVGGVGQLVAAAAFLGGIAVVLGLGVVFKDQIQLFLAFFIRACNEWGLLGCLAYMVMYTVLELLAVPAIPLTMTAGVIFGVLPGTIMTSIAGTAAATLAFLFARYVARDKVIKLAERSPKFAAIDRVLGRNGFKVVTLLRLSPLLPLAISNYIYGLTSVRLDAYVTGSFLGMLPGTFAYVTAGFLGREVLTGEAVGAAVKVQPWQVALGLAASAAGLLYVGRLAKTALDEMEQQDAAAAAGSLGKGPPPGAGDGLVQLAVAQ